MQRLAGSLPFLPLLKALEATHYRSWLSVSYLDAFLACMLQLIYLSVCNPDGAGVDIFGHDFWVRSLPQNPVSWIVVPTGRTSWVPIRSLHKGLQAWLMN